MNELTQINVKRWSLYTLIASISISAIIGILAILIGDFGQLEGRILLTTLTVSAASVCGLSCGASLETRRQKQIPLVGIVVALLAAILVIAGIWIEPRSEVFWKTTASLSILAGSLAQFSLLLLAKIQSRFQWSLWAAGGVIASVAGVLLVMLWGETDGEWIFRLLGALAVLDGAITILIPVFHYLSRGEIEPAQLTNPERLGQIDQEIRQCESKLEELRRERRMLSEGTARAKIRSDSNASISV